MDVSISGLAMAGFLFCFGIWQTYEQFQNLKELKSKSVEKRSDLRNFLIRQSWRRLQTGCLFGTAGLGMIIGLKIPGERFPFVWSLVWLGTVVMLLWGIILTVIDLIALKMRYSEECHLEKAAQYGIESLMKKNKEEK